MMIVSVIPGYIVLGAIIYKLMSITAALNIVVIGAGPAGLASSKNALERGHVVEVFEKSESLGGAWYYKEEIDKDKYNVDISGPMYENYRTHMPYQTLEFPDNYYPEKTPSYPSHKIVWNYLNRYAEKHNVTSHIKCLHLVEKVVALDNNKWNVTVRDLKNNTISTTTYDSVFVCTGVCSSPYIPKIKGAEKYKGQVMHSHDYRKPQPFKSHSVLVIGTESCGNDIVNELGGTAKQIARSYMIFPEVSHVKKIIGKAHGLCTYCFTVTAKDMQLASQDKTCPINGNVKRFTGAYEVEFENGKRQNFSYIIYATGYKHSYPYLDENTGIHVKNDQVEPLFKQILNVEHPTMAFIGIPNWEPHFRLYDLQARFALEFISGAKEMPPKLDIIKQTHKKDSKLQRSGSLQRDYYCDLARTGTIPPVRAVYSDLYMNALQHSGELGYRKYKYIVNGNNFDRVKI